MLTFLKTIKWQTYFYSNALGSFYLELTALIARKVGVKTGRVQLGKFKNNETQVELNDNVRDRDIYIIQVFFLFFSFSI